MNNAKLAAERFGLDYTEAKSRGYSDQDILEYAEWKKPAFQPDQEPQKQKVVPQEEQDNVFTRSAKKFGFNQRVAGNVATGDFTEAADILARGQQYAELNPGMQESKDLMNSITASSGKYGDGVVGSMLSAKDAMGEYLKKDIGGEEGFVNKLKATGRNIRGAGEAMVEQVPNMVPGFAGLAAGAATGGALGTATLPVIGTVSGAAVLGYAGMAAGNASVEVEGQILHALGKAGIDPQNTESVTKYLEENWGDIALSSGKKGAFITGIDMLTMKMGGKILGAAERGASNRALSKLGVDITDAKAVAKAVETKEFGSLIANDKILKQALSGKKRKLVELSAASLEPIGEYVGELGGNYLATGEVDYGGALQEALMAMGQSGVTAVGVNAYSRGKSKLSQRNMNKMAQELAGGVYLGDITAIPDKELNGLIDYGSYLNDNTSNIEGLEQALVTLHEEQVSRGIKVAEASGQFTDGQTGVGDYGQENPAMALMGQTTGLANQQSNTNSFSQKITVELGVDGASQVEQLDAVGTAHGPLTKAAVFGDMITPRTDASIEEDFFAAQAEQATRLANNDTDKFRRNQPLQIEYNQEFSPQTESNLLAEATAQARELSQNETDKLYKSKAGVLVQDWQNIEPVTEKEKVNRGIFKREADNIVREDPIYKAQQHIKAGGGLNKDQLLIDYDADIVKHITKKYPGLVTKKGTMQIDDVATELGFKDGQDLYQQLADAPSLKDAKKKIAKRLEEEYKANESDSKEYEDNEIAKNVIAVIDSAKTYSDLEILRAEMLAIPTVSPRMKKKLREFNRAIKAKAKELGVMDDLAIEIKKLNKQEKERAQRNGKKVPETGVETNGMDGEKLNGEQKKTEAEIEKQAQREGATRKTESKLNQKPAGERTENPPIEVYDDSQLERDYAEYVANRDGDTTGTTIISNDEGRAYILEDLASAVYRSVVSFRKFAEKIKEVLGKSYSKIKPKLKALYRTLSSPLNNEIGAIGDIASLTKGDTAYVKKTFPKHHKAMESAISKMAKPEQARVMANLKEHNKTLWSMATIRSLVIREMFGLAISGKEYKHLGAGTFWGGKGLDISTGKMFEALEGGEQSTKNFASSYNFFTNNSKAETDFSVSLSNCNPSKECAKFCYSTNGHGGLPSSLKKAEFTNLIAERYPDILKTRLSAYKHTAQGVNGLALRVNEKGDLSPAIVKIINELNDEGIRFQVFSKRPSLLRQIGENNWRALSIDSSNLSLASENNDLPVAVVLTDTMTDNGLLKLADRINVTLPVNFKGATMTRPQIKKRFPKSYSKITKSICPINSGEKKVKSGTTFASVQANLKAKSSNGEWTCTSCDMLGSTGCFFGENSSKKAKSISKNSPENTIANVIAGLDKLKQQGVINDETFKRISTEIGDGLGGTPRNNDRRTDRTGGNENRGGVREVKENRKGGVTYYNVIQTGHKNFHGKKIPSVEQAKETKQMSLFDFIKTEENPGKPFTSYQKKVATLRYNGKPVNTFNDVATILRPLREQAQENIYVLMLDSDNMPLAVLRHSMGGSTSSGVYLTEMIGAIHNTTGATSFWIGHNHPSGMPQESDADRNITTKIASITKDTGLKFSGQIIQTPQGVVNHLDVDGNSVDVEKVETNKEDSDKALKMVERRIKGDKIAVLNDEPALSSELGIRYAQEYSNGKSGVLLLTPGLKPLKFVPIPVSQMQRIRGAKLAKKLLGAAEKTISGSAIIIHIPKKTASSESTALNMYRFAQNNGIHALDTIVNGQSLADEGISPRNVTGEFYSKGTSQLPASQQANVEEELGKTGKSLVDSGKLRIITTEQLDDIRNNDSKSKFSKKEIKHSEDGLIEGFYDPTTGVTTLVQGNIRKGTTQNILAHEIGVHAKNLGFKDTKPFNDILKMLEERRGDNTAEGRAIKKAFDSVPSDTSPGLRSEEALGYLVNNSPKINIVRRFIASIKKFLVSKGFSPTLFKNIDLQAMAHSVVMNEAKTADHKGVLEPADIRMSAGKQSKEWYSRLSKIVKDFNVEKQPAAAWLNTLKSWTKKKLPPALQEELEWSGITDALKLMGKRKVTKDEILSLLEDGGVKVEETVIGDGIGGTSILDWGRQPLDAQIDRDYVSETSNIYNPSVVARYWAYDKDIDANILEHSDGVHELQFDGRTEGTYQSLGEAIKASGVGANRESEYSENVLHGSRNYKELLISLPDSDKQKNSGDNQYKSNHFPEVPNLLVHVRVDERIDTDGNKVLFINEIQSDWANDARNKGVRDEKLFEKKIADIRKANDAVKEDIKSMIPSFQKQVDEYEFGGKKASEEYKNIALSLAKAISDGDSVDLRWKAGDSALEHRIQYSPETGVTGGLGFFPTGLIPSDIIERSKNIKTIPVDSSVPNAPFIKSDTAWSMLGLKKAIKYAADNGFDKVAWPSTPEQIYEIEGWGEVISENEVSDANSIEASSTWKEYRKLREDKYGEFDPLKIVTGEQPDTVEMAKLRAKHEKLNAKKTVFKSQDGYGDVTAIVNRYRKGLVRNANRFLKAQMKVNEKVGETELSNGEVVNSIDITGFSDTIATGGMPLFSQNNAKEANLKKWFSGSKITEKSGKPMMMYHGSSDMFKGDDPQLWTFDKSSLGRNTNHASAGLGFFFTPDKSLARKYSDRGQVAELFMAMKNPYKMSIKESQGFDNIGAAVKRRAEIMGMGHDGIIIQTGNPKTDYYITFNSNQTKLKNNETFGDTGDIRFSKYSKEPNTTEEKQSEQQALTHTETLNASYNGYSSNSLVEAGRQQISLIYADMKKAAPTKGNAEKYSDKVLVKMQSDFVKVMDILDDTHKSIAEKEKFIASIGRKLPKEIRSELLTSLSKIARFKQDKAIKKRTVEAIDKARDAIAKHYTAKIISQIDSKIQNQKRGRNRIQKGRGREFERELLYLRSIISSTPEDIGKETSRIVSKIQELQDRVNNAETETDYDKFSMEILDLEAKLLHLDVVGGLGFKTFDEVVEARNYVNGFVGEGIASWKSRKNALKERNKANRLMVMQDVSGLPDPKPEKIGTEQRNRNEKMGSFWQTIKDAAGYMSNGIQSWETMLDKISARSGQGPLGADTVTHFGSLAHAATRDKEAMLMATHDTIRNKAEEIFGVDVDTAFNLASQPVDDKINTYDEDGNVTDTIPMSELQAAYWLSIYESAEDGDSIASTFERMGVTPETISELENLVSPEVKQWQEWITTEFMDGFYDGINEVYSAIEGIDLKKSRKYIPLLRKVKGNIEPIQPGFIKQVSDGSMKKGSLKERVRNTNEFKVADLNSVLMRHVEDMTHYKAWAIPLTEMRATFSSPDVKAIINQHHGHDAVKTITNFMDDFGASEQDKLEKLPWLDTIRSNITIAMVGMNPVVVAKQLTSIPAMSADIPLTDWLGGTTEALQSPVEKWKILSEKSPLLKSRGKRGYDKEMMNVSSSDANRAITGKKKLRELSMVGVKFGDKAAIVVGGWAVYQYHKKKALAAGKSEADADQIGIDEFEKAFERSQQSANTMSRGTFLRGGSKQNLFTMFMTAPASYSRMLEVGIRGMVNSKTKEGRAKGFKIAVVYGVVMPMVFQAVADAMLGVDGDEEEKKEFAKNQFRAVAMAYMNGMPLIRDIQKMFVNTLEGNGWYRDQFTPATSILYEGKDGLSNFLKLIKGGTSRISQEEYANRVMQNAIHLTGYALGLPTKPVERVSTGISDAVNDRTDRKVRSVMGYSRKKRGYIPDRLEAEFKTEMDSINSVIKEYKGTIDRTRRAEIRKTPEFKKRRLARNTASKIAKKENQIKRMKEQGRPTTRQEKALKAIKLRFLGKAKNTSQNNG